MSRLAAAMPMGVAALPSPKRLAQMLPLRAPEREASPAGFREQPPQQRAQQPGKGFGCPYGFHEPPYPAPQAQGPADGNGRVRPLWAPWATAALRAGPVPFHREKPTEQKISSPHRILIVIPSPPPSKGYAGHICKMIVKMHKY